MMKQLLLLLAMVFTVSLSAQDLQTAATQAASVGKFSTMLHKFSVTAAAGTGNYTNSFNQLGKLTLGELSIQYKATPSFSFGLGTTGAVLNDLSYYNSEGVLVPGCTDDEEGDDLEMDDPNDPDSIEEGHQDGNDNECDVEGELGLGNLRDNLMGNVTFRLPGKLPFFLQAMGGYSFGAQCPAYSVKAGYNQKLFAGLGISAGVRYSNIVTKTNYVSRTSGVKAELGLSWNF